MGTCEQRDTGQGHPDKGTGQRTDDYLQNQHFSALEWSIRCKYSVKTIREMILTSQHPSFKILPHLKAVPAESKDDVKI